MRRCFYCIFVLFLVTACVTEIVDSSKKDDKNLVQSVAFNYPLSTKFGDGDETRMIIKYTANYNNGGYQNYIFNGDTIGIFPSKGDQIPFVIEGLAVEAPSFTFEARGWDLRTDVTYYAYTPFNRQNYADSINIRHVNISYIGQVLDSLTATTNALLVENFNTLSEHSYLYSTPTNAVGGNLVFNMQYLGGIVRMRCIFRSMPPEYTSYDQIIIIHSKLTTDDPVFVAEGTIALDTIAKEKEAADLAGTGSSYVPKITPTKRGLVNVLPMKVDSFKLFNIMSSYYGMFYFINVPATEWRGHNLKLILYDTDYNWYYSDISSLNNAIPGYTRATNAYVYYGGKARPENIYIAPWDSLGENVNSNWNYK